MSAAVLTFRASGMGRVMACPGSAAAEAPFPFVPGGPHATRGTRLHDGMALAFRIGLNAAMAKLETLWAEGYVNKAEGFMHSVMEDLEQIAQAHAAALSIIPAGATLHIEVPLDMAFLGLDSGKPDLVWILGNQGGVIDWKFGKGPVEDPSTNPQLGSYGAGVFKKFPKLEAMNLAIIQPGTWRMDEVVREATVPKDALRSLAITVQGAVKKAKAPDAPRIASQSACRYCKAAGVCPAAMEFKAGVATTKQEVRQAELAVVTAGTPIEVSADPPLPSVVVVVSRELVAKVDERYELAVALQVTDAASATAAGNMSKDNRALAKLVDENRAGVKAPVLAYGKAIDDAARPVLTKLKDSDDIIQTKVTAYIRAEQKKAIDAQAEADKQRRLKEEAERREQEALAKASRARSAEGKAKAEAEALRQAEARRKAEEEQAAADPPPPPVSAPGFKTAEQVTFAIHDLGAVPPEWARQVLMVDERVVKALMKSGKLNETTGKGWLVITREKVAARTR